MASAFALGKCEKGGCLTAGRKARYAIVIFDEATSALDSHKEKEIQKSLKEISEHRTTLIIAHRLSTIMNADHLLVLEGGKIVEEGKPQQLLENKDSQFYKIYNIATDSEISNDKE